MLIPVLAIGTWVLTVAVALRTNHVCATPPSAPLQVPPGLPVVAWSQHLVDAEFTAMTLPLTR